MKKIHIFGIIVIAVAIGIIITTSADASTYVNFTQAEELSKDNPSQKVHVVGQLKKDPAGKVVGLNFNAALDANHFEFLLVDDKGREQKVIYNAPQPQDFGKAEKIVIIGSMNGQVFQCDKILLKCPSKYQDGKAEFEEVKKTAAI
ncbi:cytochrome c-type biogenesis protein CcmE [Pseudarcicella hirudinis]|uniref:Cytochrome c-type biogenesis protein CcmE n=1 Tax=Pseudarcicella hirudinis TaxID=1079859 RepID=A0A1I5XMJ1_9BACT|nr:cytochrome c maturation protein CcmE [Pseudarcicella hirudinis]SFQ33185.1 cytochrome c-type biogenesis protein CcmE [Pseudarcicella hirudinis]